MDNISEWDLGSMFETAEIKKIGALMYNMRYEEVQIATSGNWDLTFLQWYERLIRLKFINFDIYKLSVNVLHKNVNNTYYA